MSSPLIVYTAITGGRRDRLKPVVVPPSSCNNGIRYVCFSDSISEDEGAACGWEVLLPLWRHVDNPRRTARWHKVNSHECFPDASFTLWLDATHQVTVNPLELVNNHLGTASMATFKHGQRDCVYKELEACIKLRKDNQRVMQDQVNRYKNAGYPVNAGLYETSVMLRHHAGYTTAFNKKWWEEIRRGSYRDQLSVNFVARQVGLPVAIITGNRVSSPFFSFEPHRRG